MKTKTLLKALLLPSFALSLAACEISIPDNLSESVSETNSQTTSETSSQDTASEIISEESSIIDSSESVATLTKLDAPKIEINDDATGLKFSGASENFIIEVGSDTKEDTSMQFSSIPGEYEVKVYAKGDGVTTENSDPSTFKYKVSETTLNVEKTSATTANISYEGVGLTLDGQPYSSDAYTATESGKHTFAVTNGYDRENNINYVGTQSKTVTFSTIASSIKVLEDVEGKVTADLVDEWDITYFKDSWVPASASIKVGQLNDSSAMEFNLWNNYNKFRYSLDYSVTEGYNYINFDILGDDIITLSVQLMSSESGVYATYNYGTVSSNLTNVKLSMTDENWKVNLSGQNYPLASVISYVGLADTSEIIPYFDKVNLIFYGVTSNGAQTKIYMDNLQFEYEGNGASSITPTLNKISTSYVGSNSNGLNFKFDVTGANTATLSTLNATQLDETQSTELSIPVTYEIKGDKIYIYAEDKNQLSCVGKFKTSGASLVIIEASGALSSYVNNSTFAIGANTVLDFEDGSGNDKYRNSSWTQERYVSSWETVTDQMNSRTKDGSKVVNFYSGYDCAYKYTYNATGPAIGLTDYVSIDLGNYFNGATNLPIKISVTTTSGKKIYLLGSENDWYQYPVTTSLVKVEKYLDTALDIQSVAITVRSSANAAYLYADNLTLQFKGCKAESSEEPTEPEVPETDPTEPEEPTEITNANLSLDFEDGEGSGKYTNEKWTQEYYGSSGWVTTSGQMNSRSKDGSKVANCYSGYNVTYKYTYNKTGTPIGLTNHVEIDLGNYYSGKAYEIKVGVILTDGTALYLLGASDSFYTFDVTTGLTHFEKDLPQDIAVQSLFIAMKASSDCYLYMDNIKLTHKEASGE